MTSRHNINVRPVPQASRLVPVVLLIASAAARAPAAEPLFLVEAWAQKAKLTGSKSSTNHQFGMSVDVGDVDANNICVGSQGLYAYHYKGSGSSWSEASYNLDEDALTFCPAPVAFLDGNILAGLDFTGTTMDDTVHELSRVSHWLSHVDRHDNWDDSHSGFGLAISASGSFLAVGAPHGGDGGVYIFWKYANGSWIDHELLEPVDPDLNCDFGATVAICNTAWPPRLIVGAPSATYEDSSGSSKYLAGRAYIYEYIYEDGAASWKLVQTLTPDPPEYQGQFGLAVAITENNAYVADIANYGRVRRYARDSSGNWGSTASGSVNVFGVRALDAAPGSRGDRVLVGAPVVNSYRGAAYLYETSVLGRLSLVATLTASDGSSNDNFGAAVAYSGSRIVVGAPGDSYGSAYVFEKYYKIK